MDTIADYCGAMIDGGDFPSSKLIDAREDIFEIAARVSGMDRSDVLPLMNGSSGIEICNAAIADEVQAWLDDTPRY